MSLDSLIWRIKATELFVCGFPSILIIHNFQNFNRIFKLTGRRLNDYLACVRNPLRPAWSNYCCCLREFGHLCRKNWSTQGVLCHSSIGLFTYVFEQTTNAENLAQYLNFSVILSSSGQKACFRLYHRIRFLQCWGSPNYRCPISPPCTFHVQFRWFSWTFAPA